MRTKVQLLGLAALAACGTGKFGGLPGDGGVAVDAAPDLCADVRCPPEQSCVAGACVTVDPCAGVTCEGGVTVCSYGSCVNGSVDEDGDGSPAAEDCDDRNQNVLAGSTRACEGDCGQGLSTCVGGQWGQCVTPEPCACTAGERAEAGCGRCGTASFECGADGRWRAPSGCAGEGLCGAGTEGIEPCPVGGACSVRRRACDASCSWQAWRECESQTECDPEEIETQDCGDCGTHERSCSSSCLWNAFDDCVGEGVCTPLEVGRQGCGDCGSQSRTCRSDCTWPSFGACTGEGACSAGADETRGCGDCGDQSRTCNASCQWGSWGACTGEGACTPGSNESRGCGDCGTQTRTCAGDCTWGSWGACAGEGVCSEGATSSRGCGNCGTQSRTCTAACTWGSYGACGGEGVCSAGATSSQGCGNCGTQTRTCSAACAWGAYGACGGQGVCAPGASQQQACGSCGTQSRTCTGACAWGGWGACNGTCCSQVAANWCAAKGWPVVGAAQGGNIVCTIDGRSDGNNCDACATYNIVVWVNGSEERHCPGVYSTVAGGVYSAHNPCACGDNLTLCENWNMQGCVPD